MKKIEELQADLRAIAAELEELKESKTADGFNEGIKEAAAYAYRSPIVGHPLSSEDEHSKRHYLTLLMSAASLDPDSFYENTILIHRIAFGAGYIKKGGDLHDEYIASQTLSFERLDEFTSLFLDSELRYLIAFELVMIAAVMKKERRKANSFIADVCALMNISEEELTLTCEFVKLILEEDYSKADLSKYRNGTTVDKLMPLLKCYFKATGLLTDFSDSKFTKLKFRIINPEINVHKYVRFAGIEWIVLEREKNSLLLLSRYVINDMYKNKDQLRDFYQKNFNDSEKSIIYVIDRPGFITKKKIKLEDVFREYEEGEENFGDLFYRFDVVFLLFEEEVKKYLPTNKLREADNTWIICPSHPYDKWVTSDGCIHSDWRDRGPECGYRPAIWIDIEL